MHIHKALHTHTHTLRCRNRMHTHTHFGFPNPVRSSPITGIWIDFAVRRRWPPKALGANSSSSLGDASISARTHTHWHIRRLHFTSLLQPKNSCWYRLSAYKRNKTVVLLFLFLSSTKDAAQIKKTCFFFHL